MTEHDRVQAAIAEYNQFVTLLQARYGVTAELCITTIEYASGKEPKRILNVTMEPVPNWQPPAPPEPTPAE